MSRPPARLTRLPVRLVPDPVRVIARAHLPSGEHRLRTIVDRVLALPEAEVSALLAAVMTDFSSRHRDIKTVLDRNFREVEHHLDGKNTLSDDRRQLIGAYFTMEYSLESVALFNPSMVLHTDQSGLDDGAARFIMSLRACGEGHISSIEFRSGVISESNDIEFDPICPFAMTERPVADKLYERQRFFRKLLEMGPQNLLVELVVQQLNDQFTMDELKSTIERLRPVQGHIAAFEDLAESMMWLARSNYHLDFPEESSLCERVIFPVTENESRGIEDARFVRFANDDGSILYYATYTAYNGLRTLPQFIETADFVHFKIYTLNGKYVQNKGMALFPRRVNGEYLMVARLDGENLFLLRSDSVHFWNEAERIRTPVQPWEFVQIGNCGSPIETDRGWLVLTHGVGPMRQYWLGALLLDLEDPGRVIGHLDGPILMPQETERDGYVPNVVYSCGAMLHNHTLVVPYAIADTSTSVAVVSLSDLLDGLTSA